MKTAVILSTYLQLLQFYINLSGITNSTTTDRVCFITCGNMRFHGAVSQYCRTGCPNLKWTEPLQQQWLLSVFISTLLTSLLADWGQPCVSTFAGHQRHFLSHQGRELAHPDPHHPSGHAWEHSAGGRCSSRYGRPEACFLCDHRRAHKDKVCDGCSYTQKPRGRRDF